MFGIPIDGPTDMFCDNEAVYKNASLPESQLRKKHHSISYHMSREAVASGAIRIAKEEGRCSDKSGRSVHKGTPEAEKGISTE